MPIQKVLVTGGAGYVGSRLVPVLAAQGYQVRVLDLFLFGDTLPGAPLRLDLVRGDIRDRPTVEECLDGIDAVIHLAAISNDPSSELDPRLTREVNLEAVRQLVEAAQRSGVRRFINASSASVYGIKEEANITEEMSLEPITLYARCKAEAEASVRAANGPGFVTVSVRPATLCGYAPRLRLDLTVNILTHHALRKGKITVFGGQQKRPNLTIRDMVDVYVLLLRAKDEQIAGEVFNVGARNYAVLEIARLVRDTLDRDVAIEIAPNPDHRSYHISSEKIARMLGYTPRFTVQDAILELRDAFAAGKVPDPDEPKYYNVRLMREKLSVDAIT